MPGVAVNARAGNPAETDADARVIVVLEGEPLDDSELEELVDSGEAKPGPRKVAVAHERTDGGRRRVILVGLGKRDELDREKARVAAAAAAGRARGLGSQSLSRAAPRGGGVAGAPLEGALLAPHPLDPLKTSPDDDEERKRPRPKSRQPPNP